MILYYPFLQTIKNKYINMFNNKQQKPNINKK